MRFSSAFPEMSWLTGEIVIVTAAGLDFDSLQLRLHPAASRVYPPGGGNPASFVAFDLLAANARNLMGAPQLNAASCWNERCQWPRRPST
jgi:ATP-dependent DNA ligase